MPVIEFDDADLVYPVREHQGLTLKDFIVRGLFRKKYNERWRTVHALKDITFRVDHGERVGIIGNNGAGKSTLLRTIGGVYPISKGTRNVVGSICSLYDIAVGFEAAATGWNNIRYRGYLQGETPLSIEAKMQNIAEFTELGDFLNLPLNCYSTGMLMRLAFAIATSVDPEVLLIDEVFGTGDVRFQKKAQDRMVDFMNKASIVVMVGHNLDFLAQFCTRMLWLEQGRIRLDGKPGRVIAEYQGNIATVAAAA